MSETLKIKIKYFYKYSEDEKVRKFKVGDWIDLRCAERTQLFYMDSKKIPLGIGMILPEGYEAHILPRSSTFDKYGIIMTNSMGIVDNVYSGELDQWKMPVLAMRETIIDKGERICQFRIMKKMPEVEFIEVEHLNEISRGGFGSTGSK